MDTVNAIGGAKLRISMILTTVNFIWDITRNLCVLLKADNQLWEWQTAKDAGSLLFNGQNGFVRKLFRPWLSFMRQSFHPSQHNNDNLLLKYSKI